MVAGAPSTVIANSLLRRAVVCMGARCSQGHLVRVSIVRVSVSAADFPIEPGEGEASVETEVRSGPFAGRTAWARNLEAPLRDFLRTETGSAAILFIGAVAAMVWINVDAASYNKVWNTMLSVRIGGGGISQDLRHWVNNG